MAFPDLNVGFEPEYDFPEDLFEEAGEDGDQYRKEISILDGTAKIIVDTFGYYIPPKKPPSPEFPRPMKFEDIEKLKKEKPEETVPEETAPEELPIGEDEGGLIEAPFIDKPTPFPKQIVRRYTFVNSRGTTVSVINYGATVTSIQCPDKNGAYVDIVLGFDNMDGYQSDKNQFFGSTLGRFSSIITEGKFKIGTEEFYVTQNNGQHHQLGGKCGFDKVMWDSCVYKNKVVMTYISIDREEGYPGNVMVQTEFTLSKNDIFTIHTTAQCSKPTVISIANNILFNLAGHGSGPDGLKQHSLMVNADRFIVNDPDTGFPTSEIKNVGATYYDLRVPRPLARAIKKAPGGGYSQTFCLTKGMTRPQSVCFAARLVHPESGRFLEIQTDQPGLYVYTCNNLPNPDPAFVEPSTPEEVEYKCRMEFGDGGEIWPMRVLSKQIWERPVSDPEEEHIFPLETEETFTATSEQWGGNEDDFTNASVFEQDGDTHRHGVPPFDPEEFYRDEAESLNEEMEPEEMYGEELIEGKFGCTYRNHGGIVLMPQEYPDSPKYKHFPSPVLQPTKIYSKTTTYRLGIIPLRKDENIADIY